MPEMPWLLNAEKSVASKCRKRNGSFMPKDDSHAGLDDGALGVVDDHTPGHPAEPFEGPAVASEPGGHPLVPDEFQVLVAREAQGHHKGPGAPHLAAGRIVQHGARTKVHLNGLTWAKRQGNRGL